MFIINQKGNRCEEIEKINYELDWDDETSNALQDIYNAICSKAYNYVSMDDYMNKIRSEQSNYIRCHKCKKILCLYVNDNKFATYKDIGKGINIFDKIMNYLKIGENLFNLNEYREKI